jgi:hypothetical protein
MADFIYLLLAFFIYFGHSMNLALIEFILLIYFWAGSIYGFARITEPEMCHVSRKSNKDQLSWWPLKEKANFSFIHQTGNVFIKHWEQFNIQIQCAINVNVSRMSNKDEPWWWQLTAKVNFSFSLQNKCAINVTISRMSNKYKP